MSKQPPRLQEALFTEMDGGWRKRLCVDSGHSPTLVLVWRVETDRSSCGGGYPVKSYWKGKGRIDQPCWDRKPDDRVPGGDHSHIEMAADSRYVRDITLNNLTSAPRWIGNHPPNGQKPSFLPSCVMPGFAVQYRL